MYYISSVFVSLTAELWWEGASQFICTGSKCVSFSKYSWQPHQSGFMSNMFDIIQEHISCHDICLETNLRPNSKKNKHANHGYCQKLIEFFFVIHAFQVGLFYVSAFLPILAYACHVSEVCGHTTVIVFRHKPSWQILYTCQTVRRWKTVRQR